MVHFDESAGETQDQITKRIEKAIIVEEEKIKILKLEIEARGLIVRTLEDILNPPAINKVGTKIDYSKKSQNMSVYHPLSGRKDVKH